MYKSVIVSVFVVVISLTSMTALATVEETVRPAKKSLSLENSVLSMQSIIAVTDIRSAASSYDVKGTVVKSHDNDTSESKLFSGWMLALALFGFVIMSNRRGV
jgi:ssDNA-binding replication factor A large subunit